MTTTTMTKDYRFDSSSVDTMKQPWANFDVPFPRVFWNFVELYVWGKSSVTLWNFIMGLMERNNCGTTLGKF